MKLRDLLNVISPHPVARVRRAKAREQEPSYVFREKKKLMCFLGRNTGYQRTPVPEGWYKWADFELVGTQTILPEEGLLTRTELKEQRGWTDGLIKQYLGEYHSEVHGPGKPSCQNTEHCWARHTVLLAEQDSELAAELKNILGTRAREALLDYLRTADLPPGFSLNFTGEEIKWDPSDKSLNDLIAAAQLNPDSMGPVLEVVKQRMAELESNHAQQFSQALAKVQSVPLGFRVEVNSDQSLFLHGPYSEALYNRVIRPYFNETTNWRRQRPKNAIYSQLLANTINQCEPDKEEARVQLQKFKEALETLPDPLPVDFDVRCDGDSGNVILYGEYHGSIYRRIFVNFFSRRDDRPGKDKWRYQRPLLTVFTKLLLEAIAARRPRVPL